MPMRLGPLASLLTPPTPVQPYRGKQGTQALIRMSEHAAGLGERAKAHRLQVRGAELKESQLAERRRHQLETEVHARSVLDETKRSALVQEADAAQTQERLRRKQAATLYQAANTAALAGDDNGAKMLLSIAGYDVQDLNSPEEIQAAVEGLGEVVSTGELQERTFEEPGVPLTTAEKREKLGIQDPFPEGLPGLGAGMVPRGTLGEGAAPGGVQAPAEAAPPLPGAQPLPAPAAQPGAAAPAYDPSQVPAGQAPPGMTRAQYLEAERAQEPAYAQQPALPAEAPPLPGQMSLMEKVGANIAAAERDPGYLVTTPFGDQLQWNPAGRREQVKANVKDYFSRYVQGSDPLDMPTAMKVRNLAEQALKMHGGDAEKTAAFLDKVLGRGEKEAHADYRKEIGAEAAMALQGAKRGAQKGAQYNRTYLSTKRYIHQQAKSEGFYADKESLQVLRAAQDLLQSKHTNPKDRGYAQQKAVVLLTKAHEKGVLTDKDIERNKYGYMSLAGKVKSWVSESKDGVLKPAHIEKILKTIRQSRLGRLKHMQKVRNTFDANGDTSPDGAIADAYRDWTRASFIPFGIRRERTLSEQMANSQQRSRQGTPLDPRIHRIPDRDEVRAEAEAVRQTQGDAAARAVLEEAGLEDVDSTIDDLLMEGAGVAP